MSVRFFLFLLSVAALSKAAAVPGKGKSAEVACEKYLLPVCTRDYNPVCGSDGKTHANECMLCLYNMENHLTTYIVKNGIC